MDLLISDRNFLYHFILADVEQPLLGSNFLAHFLLLLDPVWRLLLEVASLLPMVQQLLKWHMPLLVYSLQKITEEMQNRLTGFPGIMAIASAVPGSPVVSVQHTVKTMGRPVSPRHGDWIRRS